MSRLNKAAVKNPSSQRLAAWCLGILWMMSAGIGVTVVFSETSRSRVTGWIFLLLAAVLFLVTMDRWIRALPGLLGYGVFGALLATVSGHGINRQDLPISKPEGIVLMLFFCLSAIVSYTFSKRRLRLLDRIALFGFVSLVFRAIWFDSISATGLGIPLGCLVVAWGYDRYSVSRSVPAHT
jgi:hypothetical protein